MFGWVRRKKNKLWGLNAFSPYPPICFLSKMKRKLSKNEFFLDWQKYPYACAHGLPLLYFFPLFWVVMLSFLSSSSSSSSSFYFLFFIFLTRHNFFLGHDFYFFNKFDWLFFLVIICHFFILIGHYSLTKIYEEIYSNLFFSSLDFSTSNQTKKRKNKIFSILLFFHSSD